MNSHTSKYDEYIRDTLEQAINNVIKTEGYVTFTVNKRPITTKGDSFLGTLYEVDIKGETVEGANETNIFMKICNPNNKITFIDISQAYINELYVYEELYNVYASLEEEFNVPLNERYTMIKFYNVASQDVVALENMRGQGFVTPHRTEMVSLDFIELALIELAKFHTLSFVMEHKRPNYFEKKIKNIKTGLSLNEEWRKFVTNLTRKAVKYVDKDAEIKLVNLLYGTTKRYFMLRENTNTVRCLCHGDYKQSNILMKNIGGVTLKVIPIDYQMIIYGSPVLDILYFIFGSTDREFRREHLLHLKDVYHNTLKKFLEYFNMNVEMVYPRKEFERAFEEKRDYGFIISMMVTPLLFAKDDVTESTLAAFTAHQASEECKRRLMGTIEEFIEWGYL